MNKAVYDTRFFFEYYYSKDEKLLKRAKEERFRKEKFVSAAVIYELFKLSIASEGREAAKVKTAAIKEGFEVIPIDENIAEAAAELSHKYNLSMGDSIIAATALAMDAACVTDDPHFKQIKEIKTAWI